MEFCWYLSYFDERQLEKCAPQFGVYSGSCPALNSEHMFAARLLGHKTKSFQYPPR